MKKIFTLSTCDTSKKIIGLVDFTALGFDIQDIKKETISEEDLEALKTLSGSYEALFSRRAQKYKTLKLRDQKLSEDDYKSYILKEYTFLKRPVIIDGENIFIGNSKKNIEAIQQHFLP